MQKQDFFSSSKFVTELTPKDFDPVSTWKLKKDDACAIVLFYVPWCPYCQAVKEAWQDLGEKAAFFDVYSMNCEKYSEFCSKIREDNPDLIVSYPTMIIYTNGSPTEKVGIDESKRTVKNFIKACMRVCDKSYHYIDPPKKKKGC